MSTFAVFGMTIDVATAEARKKTSGTRKKLKAPGGVEPIPEPEWLELVRKRAEKIMGGGYGASALAIVRRAAVRRAVHGAGSQDFALS
ncbi:MULTISPECIES: hypothetical protein [Pseudomonas]|uniref:hypothetical protein n=1 Tax=Pseudomonas TaxID=286 RepID=UPI0009DFDAD0|nr:MULTISPECIES: hypothetical protein [Pseudomonas]MBB4055114.1 propanediol dehydratase large subunit [Pseudomonas koreensis]TSB49317.1 hypothetical protein FEE99_25820 [Pseudomonas sp. ef1]